MTNSRSTSIIAIAVALAAIFFALGNPGRIDAVPSQMSHEMSGIVQAISHQSLTILATGSSKPEAYSWNTKDTKFFRDGAPTTVGSLAPGTRVTIHCSHPIFGSKPLLYRVSWQTR